MQYAIENRKSLSPSFLSPLCIPQVASASRPYEFIKFDTFMQKSRKVFIEQSSSGHMSKINEDLADIQQIMTKNIQVECADAENATISFL